MFVDDEFLALAVLAIVAIAAIATWISSAPVLTGVLPACRMRRRPCRERAAGEPKEPFVNQQTPPCCHLLIGQVADRLTWPSQVYDRGNRRLVTSCESCLSRTTSGHRRLFAKGFSEAGHVCDVMADGRDALSRRRASI